MHIYYIYFLLTNNYFWNFLHISINEFLQLKYFRVTGTPIVFKNLKLITDSLCVISWVVGILIMLAQYYLQPDMLLWHTFAYFHILAMLNCLCSLWFINCTAKGQVAEWLAQNVEDALKSPNSSNRLSAYRDLWVCKEYLQ